jgi:phosphoglycerol transferase MdoB-like AlkP superfamily enzyme
METNKHQKAGSKISLWQIVFAPVILLYCELFKKEAVGDKKNKLRLSAVVLFPVFFLYMELIQKIMTCAGFKDFLLNTFNSGLILIPCFCIVAGLLLFALCSMLPKTAARMVAGGVISFFAILFITQIIYHDFFGKYLILASIFSGGMGQLADDGVIWNTIRAIIKAIPTILLMAIPSVIIFTPLSRVLWFGDNTKFGTRKLTRSALYTAVSLVLHLILAFIISVSPLASVQSGEFDPNIAMHRFGLLRTEVLDVKYNLLGIEQNVEIQEEINLGGKPDSPPEETEKYKPNVMDIDFEALSAKTTNDKLIEMNEYFASKEPTYTNEYTGMYKGYNLIYITAEGFSPYCIDPELTPTLYKMQQEGFNFTNFYTPIWGVSTSDGEYTVCTGLLPKSGVWSFFRSGEKPNYMPFCLGNMFRSIGVNETRAYHNHTHSYYKRHISHPNMGYDYKGMGTGVEKYVKGVWPESDLEMITGSTADYVNSGKQFHTYYMTVSGHLEYNWVGNSMAVKNKDLVAHLDCNETLKAYYACNIELDRAMEKLLADLNAAGVADKTVISIAPDHYPYGLEQKEGDKYVMWKELLGHPVETNFELYESVWLLYCQGTKNAPTVEKPCCSVDMLPTVLNLFGFEYDSRLIMGSDVLSTEGGLVIFGNRSFITDMGKYNTTTGTFELAAGKSFKDEEEKSKYISGVRAIVNNKFTMSKQILEEDYYGYVFGK